MPFPTMARTSRHPEGSGLDFQTPLTVALGTHTVKVPRLFLHLRDLKKQSPDLAAELERDPFVDSPVKLRKETPREVANGQSLDRCLPSD